jgi:hypothetical protein
VTSYSSGVIEIERAICEHMSCESIFPLRIIGEMAGNIPFPCKGIKWEEFSRPRNPLL